MSGRLALPISYYQESIAQLVVVSQLLPIHTSCDCLVGGGVVTSGWRVVDQVCHNITCVLFMFR